MPRQEGLDTFRRLSKLLVEKVNIKAIPVASLASEERPAKSVRYNHGVGQTSALQVANARTVQPEELAKFLDDLIRTDSDGIIMQLGFNILAQIRCVSLDRMESIWLPFLKLVPGILEAHLIPLSTPRYQCIFGGILDAYVDKVVGKQPQMSEGSLYRPPVLCQRRCPDCVRLNNFLVDLTQRDLYVSIHSDHLETQFQNILGCTWSYVDGHSAEVRLITKMSLPNPQREHWDQCCIHAQEEMKQIGQEKLLAVLGDAHYKRITTMSHLRCAPAVPAWVPHIPSIRALAPTSGKESVQHPGTVPDPTTLGPGTTVQWHTAPGPPQSVAPVAGTKRPARPYGEVIDLTWMD